MFSVELNLCRHQNDWHFANNILVFIFFKNQQLVMLSFDVVFIDSLKLLNKQSKYRIALM